jgi:predicted nucleotide-binding protein (sugar kinase/HSP70/actin superfamily)
MPETTIEMLMNRVGQKYKIPIYRFPIDENRFEAGFDTRIETFISVLRRKKKCILG